MSFFTKLVRAATSALSVSTDERKENPVSEVIPSAPPVQPAEVKELAVVAPVPEPEFIPVPAPKGRKGKGKGPGQDGLTRAERRERDKLRTQSRNQDRSNKARRRAAVDEGMGCQF